jgi:hypothetical protein
MIIYRDVFNSCNVWINYMCGTRLVRFTVKIFQFTDSLMRCNPHLHRVAPLRWAFIRAYNVRHIGMQFCMPGRTKAAASVCVLPVCAFKHVENHWGSTHRYAREKASSNTYIVHVCGSRRSRVDHGDAYIKIKSTSMQDWIIELMTGDDRARILPNQRTSRYKKL